jgi:HK97 family phage prohead protease
VTVTDVRTSPAREDLCRSAPFTLTRTTDEGSDGLTIEGYGAVFNSVTRISGWEGDFEETIAPGAFKKSLRERVPRMQFDHGQHPLLGSLPLGRWTVAEEDERGLRLVGRLTDNWLVDAIRDGGVEGMSFRFAVVRDEWTDAKGTRLRDHEIADHLYGGGSDRGPIRRTLREVKASEAGPVVWPAYEDTAVGVRSRGTVVIDLARLRDPAEQRKLADLVALTDHASRTKDEPAEQVAQPPANVVIKDNVVTEVDTPPNEANEQINEPQPTAPTADNHPAPEAAPEVTERAAGEHSAPARPANPFERRDLIRAEYRDRLKHLLAIQSSPNQKESA